jgi:chemotaxis response regulator CheB
MGKEKSTPASPVAASRKLGPQSKPASHRQKTAIGAPVKSDASKFKPDASDESAALEPAASQSFPIVGIGASAGGLEAFTKLLEQLPPDTGMAFVLVQHLAPKHESMLTELLSRTTSMPVNEVMDGMTVESNHVYVIPPNADMAILQGVLRLFPRPEGHGNSTCRLITSCVRWRKIKKPCDWYHSFRHRFDGALGLKAIKAEGGITFAQDEATANIMACRTAPLPPATSISFCRPKKSPRSWQNRPPSLREPGQAGEGGRVNNRG